MIRHRLNVESKIEKYFKSREDLEEKVYGYLIWADKQNWDNYYGWGRVPVVITVTYDSEDTKSYTIGFVSENNMAQRIVLSSNNKTIIVSLIEEFLSKYAYLYETKDIKFISEL